MRVLVRFIRDVFVENYDPTIEGDVFSVLENISYLIFPRGIPPHVDG